MSFEKSLRFVVGFVVGAVGVHLFLLLLAWAFFAVERYGLVIG